MNKIYIILRNNQHEGPYNVDEIKGLSIYKHDFIKIVGSKKGWQYAGDVPDLANYLADGNSVASSIPELGSASLPAPQPLKQSSQDTNVYNEKILTPEVAQVESGSKPADVTPVRSVNKPVFVSVTPNQQQTVQTDPVKIIMQPTEEEVIPIADLKMIDPTGISNNPVFIRPDTGTTKPVFSDDVQITENVPVKNVASNESLSFEERIEKIRRNVAVYENKIPVKTVPIDPPVESKSISSQIIVGTTNVIAGVTDESIPAPLPEPVKVEQVINPQNKKELALKTKREPVFVRPSEADNAGFIPVENKPEPIEVVAPVPVFKPDIIPDEVVNETIPVKEEKPSQGQGLRLHVERPDQQKKIAVVSNNNPVFVSLPVANRGIESDTNDSFATTEFSDRTDNSPGDAGLAEAISFDDRIEKIRQAAIVTKDRSAMSKPDVASASRNPTLLDLSRNRHSNQPGTELLTERKTTGNKKKLLIGIASLVMIAALFAAITFSKDQPLTGKGELVSSKAGIGQEAIAANNPSTSGERDIVENRSESKDKNKVEDDKQIVETIPAPEQPDVPLKTALTKEPSSAVTGIEASKKDTQETVITIEKPVTQPVVTETKKPDLTQQIFLKPAYTTIENQTGIFNVNITLQNKSDKVLKTVAVNVFFNDDLGRVLNKQTLYFTEVKPGETVSRAASQHKWATKASCELGLVSSEGVLYYSN